LRPQSLLPYHQDTIYAAWVASLKLLRGLLPGHFHPWRQEPFLAHAARRCQGAFLRRGFFERLTAAASEHGRVPAERGNVSCVNFGKGLCQPGLAQVLGPES
jgi:hypothetical protein